MAPGGDALGTKAVRFATHLLASFSLLLAGTAVLPADEFRTPAISAVRVEWRAALDQLRSEINTRPAVAPAFNFIGQRRLPPFDPQTGESEIVAWTAVDDFGTVINPMIVAGQVHGGIAQGVGQALLEGVVYDKDGQLVTGSLMDYCMPRAHNLPTLKVDLTMTKSPSNPLGIKGCGEAGAIAAPVAVINAITDAIGTEDLAMPATAQTVWQALQKANSRRQAA